MIDIIAGGFLVSGVAFMLLATIGITRMPDLLSRMQTATKASSLGLALMVIAATIHFHDVGVTLRALGIIGFGFLTVPVAAHMIGRAAYFIGEPLWEGTIIDELEGRYDPETHELASPTRLKERPDANGKAGPTAGA